MIIFAFAWVLKLGKYNLNTLHDVIMYWAKKISKNAQDVFGKFPDIPRS